MDRESLFVSADDPNGPSELERKLRQLQAENADLRMKLSKAKKLLIKLDQRLKERKQQDAPPPPPCPVCGTVRGVETAAEAESKAAVEMVRESVRASQATRAGQTRELARPPPIPVKRHTASAKCYFTALPFRFVYSLIMLLGRSSYAQLALCNQEWATNVRLFRKHQRSTMLSFAFYEEELAHRKVLVNIAEYRDQMSKANIVSETELKHLFSNIITLLGFENIACQDLCDRIRLWKAGDNISEACVIIARGLRVYAPYYADYETVMLQTLKECKYRVDFVQFLQKMTTTRKLPDLERLLKLCVERLDSYRVFFGLLQEVCHDEAGKKTFAQALERADENFRRFNEYRTSREQAVLLSAVLKQISHLPPLGANLEVNEVRLLREGEVLKVTRSAKPVRLVLLTTCVIVAVPTKSATVKWKCDEVVELHEIQGARRVSMVQFSVSSADKTYTFQCPTEQSCDEWISAFVNCKAQAAAATSNSSPPPSRSESGGLTASADRTISSTETSPRKPRSAIANKFNTLTGRSRNTK